MTSMASMTSNTTLLFSLLSFPTPFLHPCYNASHKTPAQTRIDGYFTVTYGDDQRAAKFQSKRLIEATRALKRKRDQKNLSVVDMVKGAPKGFDKVFVNAKENLLFCMEQNTDDLKAAMEGVKTQRERVEKVLMERRVGSEVVEGEVGEEAGEEVGEEGQGKSRKEQQHQVVCYLYLESLMKTMLEARN